VVFLSKMVFNLTLLEQLKPTDLPISFNQVSSKDRWTASMTREFFKLQRFHYHGTYRIDNDEIGL